MNDSTSHDIVTAVRSVRRFTEDVAKLLATARDSLDRAGWKSRSSQAISVSTSLNNPSSWIPQDAFWFVLNERLPSHLVILSVVFDSIENPSQFDVPVVAVVYVRFKEPVRDNWAFRWSRLCEKTNSIADGQFREVLPKLLGDPDGVEHAEVAAWPVVSITSAEVLERTILEPLLARIRR